IGEQRIELGLTLPPQRPELASAGVNSVRIEVRNLPWTDGTLHATVTSLDGVAHGPQPVTVSETGTLQLDIPLPPQSAILVEL
ncbi:hypothetical protein ACSTLX_25790, partial [Vibrio parahaemolyticus]